MLWVEPSRETRIVVPPVRSRRKTSPVLLVSFFTSAEYDCMSTNRPEFDTSSSEESFEPRCSSLRTDTIDVFPVDSTFTKTSRVRLESVFTRLMAFDEKATMLPFGEITAWKLSPLACLPFESVETLDVVPRYLITGRRVAGSSFGGVKGRDQVPELVDRWLAGEIDVAPLISHRLTLDQVSHAFELMEAQNGIRSVIEFQ